MSSEPEPSFQAVVYDLDGTLVRLGVDWDAARDAVSEIYRDAGIGVDDMGLWELLLNAPQHGLEESVEDTIAKFERDGAERSVRLATADELTARSEPIGVCSLNCEAACRIALNHHGLLEYVDVIVGRDSVSTYKPDPEPLLSVVRSLSVDPERTLFIGDAERDEITARRAGTQFSYVSE